jgi:hypothetical protein
VQNQIVFENVLEVCPRLADTGGTRNIEHATTTSVRKSASLECERDAHSELVQNVEIGTCGRVRARSIPSPPGPVKAVVIVWGR